MERKFPFTDTRDFGVVKKFFIDQEGCGIEGNTLLRIFYCPVCGRQIGQKE